MDADRLKEDCCEGRVDVDRLVELVVALQRELQAAKRRIAELEQKLGTAPTQKIDVARPNTRVSCICE